MKDEDVKISRRGFLKATSIGVAGGLLLGSDVLATTLNNDFAVDVVYFNGKIVTLDSASSTVEAVAVKDGKILKVGS
jgi:hypothetical protein